MIKKAYGQYVPQNACRQYHTERTNSLCGSDEKLLVFIMAVHIDTTWH
jgi:hypothetical protein